MGQNDGDNWDWLQFILRSIYHFLQNGNPNWGLWNSSDCFQRKSSLGIWGEIGHLEVGQSEFQVQMERAIKQTENTLITLKSSIMFPCNSPSTRPLRNYWKKKNKFSDRSLPYYDILVQCQLRFKQVLVRHFQTFPTVVFWFYFILMISHQ